MSAQIKIYQMELNATDQSKAGKGNKEIRSIRAGWRKAWFSIRQTGSPQCTDDLEQRPEGGETARLVAVRKKNSPGCGCSVHTGLELGV